MKPIEPALHDEPRLRTSSDDLVRLARQFGGSMQVECVSCRQWVRLTIESRTLRIGSSPDLSAIDPSQPGRPRLVFYCLQCRRIMGYVQADEWAVDAREAVTANAAAETRWDHLELQDAVDPLADTQR